MDKLAIISDIHGNIPALESVLSDIRNRGINKIYCLGDLAGKGPSSDVAVDMIKANCEVVLKGNWDYIISEKYDSDILLWHQNKLGKDRMDYLKQLPIYMNFYMSGRMVRLCHASPNDVFHRVQSAAPVEDKLKLFKAPDGEIKDSDIVGYGDVHSAFIQNFRGKTLFNPGSVGNPLEISQASYAVLEGEFGCKEDRGFSINIVRVPYNIEESINQAIEGEILDLEQYISELRTARYRGLSK
jgi:protein phosphatase